MDDKGEITEESLDKWVLLYHQIGSAAGFFVDEEEDEQKAEQVTKDEK